MTPEVNGEVRLVSLPTRATLDAAHGGAGDLKRQLVFVKLETPDGVGWGECSALNTSSYNGETAAQSFAAIVGGWSLKPMAAAALEMAQIDARLRAEQRSLATYLGATRDEVVAGATVGLGSTRAADLVERGYRRIKFKVAPGRVPEVPAGVEVHVDANGSFDSASLVELVAAAEHASVIEQPFAGSPPELDAIVVADESARPDVAFAIEHFDGVALKPPCVGGIRAAATQLKTIASAGKSISIGGMLEGSLGRHVLAAFAAIEAVDLVGDVSPSELWLADDPWPQLRFDNGFIEVPTGSGIAPWPDEDKLDHYTIERATISAT